MSLHPTKVLALRNGLVRATCIAVSGLLLLAAGCDAPNDTPASASDVDSGASADPDGGASRAQPRTSASAADAAPALSARDVEVARMQAHLDSLYAQSDVVHRFTTVFGDAVDCVPFQRQPGFAQVKSLDGVPPVLAAQPALARAAAVAGFGDGVDAAGNSRSCPAGAVPIRRLTLAEMLRFATLEDFFAKAPHHEVPPNGSAVVGPNNDLHEHAVYQSTVPNWGAQTTLNLWTPAVAPNTFSLSQLWVVRGADADLQTVEAGYTADRFRHGDDGDPRLFIYSTSDNYKNETLTGCYDLECKAFVQLADTHVLVGGKFDKSSVFDGEQRELTLRWQFCPAAECRAWEGWWLRYDGGATSEWVGFYPRSRYSATGLRDEASRIDFGGEVAYFAGGGHPTTDMGSGQLAAAGFGRAAYQANLLRITTGRAWASFDSLLSPAAEAEGCYGTGSLIALPRFPARSFYFGGSGYGEVCK